MSLWVDKYKPASLQQLTFHDDLTTQLAALATSQDFPHLLLYGPSGAGKKTRVQCLLDALYGTSSHKIKIDSRTLTTTSNKKLEFNVVSSSNHVEITPADLGNNDRVVIQELLKEIAQTEQVDLSTGKHRFKTVVINEAEGLSRDAQAALRRTMEKYSRNVRLILIATTTSNIIAPIKSRTLLIRVAAPEINEVVGVLSSVAKTQNLQVSESTLTRIAQESGRNVRRAVLLFEAMAMQNEVLNDDTPVIKMDWEGVIVKMAQNIVKDRSVGRIGMCRTVLYELLSHCIPATVILKQLMLEIVKLVGDPVKIDVIQLGAIFDERLVLGNKPIYHLEGFVAKSMVAIESH